MGDASSKRGWSWMVLVLGLCFLTSLAGLIVGLRQLPQSAGLPVPKPNGYDTLLAASKLVTGMPPAQGMADKATDEELRAFLCLNERALAAAEPGLTQQSVVPLLREGSIEAHMDGMGASRQLGRVLTCRAVLARREQRIADAVQANLDLLEFAHAVAYGGLIIDQLTGAAIERPALDELAGPLLASLSSPAARRVIAALERLEHGRESVQEVAARDLDFALAAQGLLMRMTYAWNRKALNALRVPAVNAVVAAARQSQRRIRSLMVKLALHAYALDHPDQPDPVDLPSLVPAYLEDVPRTSGNGRHLTLDDFQLEPTPIPLQTT